MEQGQAADEPMLGRRQQGDQHRPEKGNPQDEAEHAHGR
jgi:hypothetical protein